MKSPVGMVFEKGYGVQLITGIHAGTDPRGGVRPFTHLRHTGQALDANEWSGAHRLQLLLKHIEAV